MKKQTAVKKVQVKSFQTSPLILELALLLSLVTIFFALYMQSYVDHMLLQDRIYILQHMHENNTTVPVSVSDTITPTPAE